MYPSQVMVALPSASVFTLHIAPSAGFSAAKLKLVFVPVGLPTIGNMLWNLLLYGVPLYLGVFSLTFRDWDTIPKEKEEYIEEAGASELEIAIWSYKNVVNTLNTVAKETTGIASARSITVDDITNFEWEFGQDENNHPCVFITFNAINPILLENQDIF